MGFDAGALFVRIEARDRQLIAALNNVENELKETKKGMENMEKGAKDSFSAASRSAALFGVAVSKAWDMATAGISMLVRGIYSASKAAIGMASDAGELGSKFDYVFGDQTESAKQQLDAFGEAVGRSKQDLYNMASGLQSILVPMGFNRDAAAEMSVAVTKLATDIGSFNNESDTEVMDAIKSAIIGNTEAVRKYGIVINEATLNQQLMAMGIEAGTQGATEQQKALARLNLIMQGTADAQGDAERTAGSFANQGRALWAAVADLGVEFGSMLLPALNLFTGAAKDAVQWAQNNITALEGWGDTFAGWAERILEGVKLAILVVTNYDLAWKTTLLTVQQGLTNAVERVQWFASNAWEFIRWFFTNFFDIAKTTGQNFIQVWVNVATNFREIWKRIWQMIKTGGREGFNELVQLVTADMKSFASAPEFKAFQGTDFSDQWAANAQEWASRMDAMQGKAKQVGQTTRKELDLSSIFKQLEGGASGSGSKGMEIRVAITGIEEQFRKTLTARFEDSDSKKSVRLQEATARNTEELVRKQDENTDKIVNAVKDNVGAAE
jgi:hypothetical protein